MGIIRRYRTALSRHHRSKGHGIHSPFAFHFVRFVLREKLPYYSYNELASIRQAIVHLLRGSKNHPRVISLKGLKLVFRVTNFFNPASILQIGTNYGLTEACMLSVADGSRLWLYDPHLYAYPVTGTVLAPLLERIDCFNDLAVALDDYAGGVSATGSTPYVLVNSIPAADDLPALQQSLLKMLGGDSVIMLRNIHRSNEMKRLWQFLEDNQPKGQSFTNEKTAVLVSRPKLNREQFFLWF